jgi:hypothetical protein
MAKIEFPTPLKQLLEESDLQAPIRGLADRVGEILADNKLPFFPDYTDHGTEHINCVLKSEVELVPKQVWENSRKDSDPRLLCDADAAVIIGATLLHDIAMHLRPDGFRELVSKNSRFQPLPWFKESHEEHSADRPWPELWEHYVREARRFSDRDLTNIIGEDPTRVCKFHDVPEDAGQWGRNHCLIIGEFIRRHHARLAHEVAIYGFPGLPAGSIEGQFPAMGMEQGLPLMRLADLIGLSARSHWMSLRICKSYLDSGPFYPGTPRPMGTAVLFPMALLRVADYLQIDRQRAPAILLQLRNPQSPVSVLEWKKHIAVQNIGPATDPRGKMVTVSPGLGLLLYLQLRQLLEGLQAEIDHSTAVLDEAYGTLTELGLHQLNLATRRVYSNLQSPAFRDSLPYVPNRTGFSADPNLLTLLVEPLYGKEPSVGVRELMQNAVDAVCELEAWCAAHGRPIESLDLPDQDGDVLIELIKRQDGTWFIRVRDRGIGMTSETIQNYFLRAGASFRRSAEWANEFLDEEGHPRLTRAGRFGIGAFAVFLLGPSFRLQTRHAGAERSMGYTIEASANSTLIEIRRLDGLPIGTTVEAELSSDSVKAFDLESEKYAGYQGPQKRIDWFCWDWPKVVQRVVRGPKPEMLTQQFKAPIRKAELPPEWRIIHPKGFDAVYWTFREAPTLSCNGLKVGTPRSFLSDAGFGWQVEATGLLPPKIAIMDSAANLPLTTQRYGLSQTTVPFIDELTRDVTLSFIAHCLVCGPTSRAEALSLGHRHPLAVKQISQYGDTHGGRDVSDERTPPFSFGRNRWCVSQTAMVPADPWLYTLLNATSCCIYGTLYIDDEEVENQPATRKALVRHLGTPRCALLHWHGCMSFHGRSRYERVRRVAEMPARILSVLATEGVCALGHKVETSYVLVSTDSAMRFVDPPAVTAAERRKARRYKNPDFEIWQRVQGRSALRQYFEARKGMLTPSTSMLAALELFEPILPEHEGPPRFQLSDQMPEVFFVAEIETRPVKLSPVSLIARTWDECLGARAIPLDPEARKSLIADGCKHSDLKRHIEAWQGMKRTGFDRLTER